MEELNYNPKYGLIPEQENEAVVFPVYDGKALCFKFRKLYTQKWQELKGKRVGRLLPPFLTRLQQRYSSYLQRPGLSRLPNAAFPSPAPLVDAEAANDVLAAVAKPTPFQEEMVSQSSSQASAINESPAEEPTIKATAPAAEAPKS